MKKHLLNLHFFSGNLEAVRGKGVGNLQPKVITGAAELNYKIAFFRDYNYGNICTRSYFWRE
jgi:hypothetical protein